MAESKPCCLRPHLYAIERNTLLESIIHTELTYLYFVSLFAYARPYLEAMTLPPQVIPAFSCNISPQHYQQDEKSRDRSDRRTSIAPCLDLQLYLYYPSFLRSSSLPHYTPLYHPCPHEHHPLRRPSPRAPHPHTPRPTPPPPPRENSPQHSPPQNPTPTP